MLSAPASRAVSRTGKAADRIQSAEYQTRLNAARDPDTARARMRGRMETRPEHNRMDSSFAFCPQIARSLSHQFAKMLLAPKSRQRPPEYLILRTDPQKTAPAKLLNAGVTELLR